MTQHSDTHHISYENNDKQHNDSLQNYTLNIDTQRNRLKCDTNIFYYFYAWCHYAGCLFALRHGTNLTYTHHDDI